MSRAPVINPYRIDAICSAPYYRSAARSANWLIALSSVINRVVCADIDHPGTQQSTTVSQGEYCTRKWGEYQGMLDAVFCRSILAESRVDLIRTEPGSWWDIRPTSVITRGMSQGTSVWRTSAIGLYIVWLTWTQDITKNKPIEIRHQELLSVWINHAILKLLIQAYIVYSGLLLLKPIYIYLYELIIISNLISARIYEQIWPICSCILTSDVILNLLILN